MISIWNTEVKAMNNYQSRNTLKTLDHRYGIWKTILGHVVNGKFIKEITTVFDTVENIEELLGSLLHGYQVGLEESAKASQFVFDYVYWLFYKYHKISLNCGKSFMDSCHCLKDKKATTHAKNNDDLFFMYVVRAALNHKKIRIHKEQQRNKFSCEFKRLDKVWNKNRTISVNVFIKQQRRDRKNKTR